MALNKTYNTSNSKSSATKSKKINDFLGKRNLMDILPKDIIAKVSMNCKMGFDLDKGSCKQWLSDLDKINEIVKPTGTRKDYPYKKSANIKLPLIMRGCQEYASRAYPEIINDNRVVKYDIIGQDLLQEKQKSGEKVSKYLNWLLYWKDESFEPLIDSILTQLPLTGLLFTKTYFDPNLKRARTILCKPHDLIINTNIESLAEAPRISHVVRKSLNDLVSGRNSQIYDETAVNKILQAHKNDTVMKPLEFVEQHTWYDLDNDDYAEPYINLYEKESGELIRILPRYKADSITYNVKNNKITNIEAREYFTDYHFLRSLDGTFHSYGFGAALYGLNKAANSLSNQLLDAGRLRNAPIAIADNRLAGLGTGIIGTTPGEIKYVQTFGDLDITKALDWIKFDEPSSTLYQLLNLCIQLARDISSVNDITSGNAPMDNAKTGATQIAQSESMKLHNAINKRVYSSLGRNLYKIYEFTGENLDPVEASKAIGESITRADFNMEKIDILPVADPNFAASHKIQQDVAALMVVKDLPNVNQGEITDRIVKRMITDEPDKLIMTPDEIKAQPPAPAIIKLQSDIKTAQMKGAHESEKIAIMSKQLILDAYKTQFECLQMEGNALFLIAKAGQVSVGPQLAIYQQKLDMFSGTISKILDQQVFGTSPAQVGQQPQQSPQSGDPSQGQQPSQPPVPPPGMAPPGQPPIAPDQSGGQT